ncbi:UDP-N-acetyl-D-mannosaminuronic acid dehydrogenase [Arthrobacter sp. 49Tsu3.1M3]|uniref:UDP-N-acetyl-D-mannosamine dehydrogenase n=1 Tax=Arthrobacter sp. 49Tsu3.1M3 TaxID=1279029 RepID=UPI0009A5BF38|nr:UDP-N-acetyl-D-mannosamine dehydrogenase [Arthrobacter sp. 49Tsu3.1M3]SKB81825.1 UDP-N-acetyl-D-mannosaminuronic acid dehydrogenase [Arthrobacter sp. 49Tsu3.1M3]
MTNFRTIAVIGLGYIGLPTAAILATNGLDVIGVDVNQRTVDAVNEGRVPFVEPDLGIHVAGAVSQGRLKATTETPAADAFIVAVPTPFTAEKRADLSYIEAAARGIAPVLQGGELIILESTSPPGATRHLGEYIVSLRPDLSLDGAEGRPAILLAHCPERVLPGKVMIELVTNDRIVGGITRRAADLAKDLYAVFCQGEILITDDVTAEMAKLVENSYRDVNIAFANELSVISEKLGINVWELIRLANHHPRVDILQPGPGVGGHCIAVDPWFIVAAAPAESRLIRAARTVNDEKPRWVLDQVRAAFAGLPGNAEIAVLGLAFKANIDDLRESPAIDIAHGIAESMPATRINVAEPHIDSLPGRLQHRDNVRLVPLEEAVSRSALVVVLVDHDAVRALPAEALAGKLLVDTRGVFSS